MRLTDRHVGLSCCRAYLYLFIEVHFIQNFSPLLLSWLLNSCHRILMKWLTFMTSLQCQMLIVWQSCLIIITVEKLEIFFYVVNMKSVIKGIGVGCIVWWHTSDIPRTEDISLTQLNSPHGSQGNHRSEPRNGTTESSRRTTGGVEYRPQETWW